jgi:hypothetical protein
VQDHVTKSHDAGTVQYKEWLILNDRVQPSLIAGVCLRAVKDISQISHRCVYVHTWISDVTDICKVCLTATDAIQLYRHHHTHRLLPVRYAIYTPCESDREGY